MKEEDWKLPTDAPRKPNYLVKLRKSKYKYIFIVLAANAFFLPMFLIDPQCLGMLVLPLAILLFLWVLKVENFWHQLAVGAVTFVVAALFASTAFIPMITDIPDAEIMSLDGILENGGVSPLRGERDTMFNYTITVVTNNTSAEIEAWVVLNEIHFTSINERNESMILRYWNTFEGNVTNVTYYFETQVAGTYNYFWFAVNLNGEWHKAGMVDNEQLLLPQGPLSVDSYYLFGFFILYWLLYLFQLSFFIFLIFLLFMRFMRRSGEAKQKMRERYERTKMEKEGAEVDRRRAGEGTKKITTVSMGPGAEEIFVCSECGSDVPASAKFCPNCGEPFEGEGEKSA